MEILVVYFVALMVAVAAHGVEFDNPIEKLVLLQRHAEAKVNTSRARAHLVATYSRVQRNREREGRQLHLMGEDMATRTTALTSIQDSLPFQDEAKQTQRKQFAEKLMGAAQGSISAGKKMVSGPTAEFFEASTVLSIKAAVADAIKEETLSLRQQNALDEDLDSVGMGSVLTDVFLKPALNAAHAYYGKTVSAALVKSEAAVAAAGGPGSSLLELGTLGISEISDETVFALQQELDEVDEALKLEEDMILDIASFQTKMCQGFKDESHISKIPILSRTVHSNLDGCLERYGKIAEIGAHMES